MLGALLLVAASCGDSDGAVTSTTPPVTATTRLPAATTTTSPPAATPTGPAVPTPILASGTFPISAARSFDDEGFHQAVAISADAPEAVGQGELLVVRLLDADRPDQTCDREHPLSGCVTVDWSDGESRPNVPAGGVFDNSLTVRLESGPRTFYLSESGSLADQPDDFDPG